VVATDEFLLSFPFAVLAVIALATHNFLIVLAWVLWMIACIHKLWK
jgi:hypothetical protein